MTAHSFAAIVGRQLRTTSGKVDSRRKLMGAVRAAASRLALEDDDRRAIQREVTGKDSLADMNLAEIGQVLDRLNRDRPAATGPRAVTGKIRALWWTLYWLGEVDTPDDASLDAFVRRQTGLASLRFVDHRFAPAIIEALKSWATRAGVRWPSPELVRDMGEGVDKVTPQQLERHAVLSAVYDRLRDRRLVTAPLYHGYAEAALRLGLNHWRWTPHELDAAIKLLGKRLRRDMAKSDSR